MLQFFNFINLFVSGVDFILSLGSILTSVYAIIIYVIILFGCIMAVVISLINKENKQNAGSGETPKANNNLAGNLNNLSGEKVKTEDNERSSRFFILNQLDEDRTVFEQKQYEDNITLKQLCEDFRNYAAYKSRLYYDISDIRKFVAGLCVSKIIILQGISGTGKTSLAYAFGEFLSNPSTVIPVQPMWKERTDLVGYYNEFTKRFNETTLLQKMYEANYSKDIYISVLDEVNIARIEYYFAEFLSLLELPNENRRFLDVLSDKWESDPVQLVNGQIRLPTNMWFVGTANNDDTTFSISDKVYDRAMILNLDTKADPFSPPPTKPFPLSANRFKELGVQAQKEFAITRRNEKRLEQLDAYLTENFHITFGNRIRKQILQYVPIYLSCGGGELEALDDILAKKLIRKLEMKNPVHVRNASAGFVSMLEELFGQDKMSECKKYLERICKNA